ncbi:MAG: transposase [Methyloprofundus sp.]|nr:transposase [Methyloprofundus sp.]
MNSIKPELPELNEEDRTPLVDVLLELLAWQQKQIDELEQEILKLKGETTKPDIKPSKMDKEGASEDDKSSSKRKKGPRRSKNGNLKIDETKIIQPDEIPEGSRFKGYQDRVIQDIIFQTHTIHYRLAEYITPEGQTISGQLPESIQGSSFGKNLVAFILYQYHHQHVTQPLLLEQLRDLGVDISSGKLSHFLTEDLDDFHAEKDELLKTGLSVSQYVHTDDTGARHKGKNGYCTHIGNEFFAWFSSTESKSRVNFLSCLSQGKTTLYTLNTGAIEYMAQNKLPVVILAALENASVRIGNASDWCDWMDQQGIVKPRHRKIVTEGALMGGLLDQGIPSDFSIISDDAGQFNVFDHALCWIHAERVINRLIPLNDNHVKAVDDAREQLWAIYHDLKAYKLNPVTEQADSIRQRFQILCCTKTCYETLNQALKRMGKNQHELLRVLDKPYLPLHNNLSERDIRDYVKKRKISGSTRSDAGRKARDTFASLKKTCRKHGISFWDYLKNRLLGIGDIPPLSEVIRAAAASG